MSKRVSKGDDHEANIQTNREDTLAAAEESLHPQSTDGGSDTDRRGAAGQAPSSPALEERVVELTADLQRLQAEFANYKRREDGAKAELLDMAKREVITLLLPTLDNIERALAHRPAELTDNAWAGGVEQVGKQATEALAKLGITKIASVGQPFDHNLHEAISMEGGDGEQEIVIEELQPGYRMGDKVIRHAMVKVGTK